MLHASGLAGPLPTDKGQDRLENLEELVNAPRAFVTQEGFGKDAVALPVDEHRARPKASQPGRRTGGAVRRRRRTGEIMSPLACFLTHASLEAGRQPGPGRAGRHPADDGAFGQGPGVRRRLHHRLEGACSRTRERLADTDGLEEERRLMYVAITRARQRLYLSFSQTRMLHGQTRYNVKSRFLDELPEARLKWITPRNQGFGSGFARSTSRPGSEGSGLGSIVGAGPRGTAARQAASPIKRAEGVVVGHGLRVGQSVFHNKFGEGVIVTLEGSGGTRARR